MLVCDTLAGDDLERLGWSAGATSGDEVTNVEGDEIDGDNGSGKESLTDTGVAVRLNGFFENDNSMQKICVFQFTVRFKENSQTLHSFE